MSALTYGPHRAEDAPTVKTLQIKGRPDREVPIAPALIEQRRQLNTLAAGTLRRITDRRPA